MRINLLKGKLILVFTVIGVIVLALFDQGKNKTQNFNCSQFVKDIPSPGIIQTKNLNSSKIEEVFQDPGKFETQNFNSSQFVKVIPSVLNVNNETHSLYISPWGGRLGNRMFRYAALIGTSHKYGFKPFALGPNDLLAAFKINHLTKAIPKSLPMFTEEVAARYDTRIQTLSKNQDWIMNGYFQSWKYFRESAEEIRREFAFKDSVLKTANNIVREKLKGQNHDKVKVGVHVRRGDMTSLAGKNKGFNSAPASYFLHAMDYFKKQFKEPIFIVCSDDIAWAEHNLGQEENTLFVHMSAEIDMAVLAGCQHTIISTGSYGWWAAWLADGQTIYYKHFPIKNTWLDCQFLAQDYYLPTWFSME